MNVKTSDAVVGVDGVLEKIAAVVAFPKFLTRVVVAFSSLARILGKVSTIHFPACAFFVLNWRSARAHQFHLLGQDQSTVAQRTETTVAECSLTSCV